MRALIVSNMWPTPARPALGSFVRDQVEALRRRSDVEVELATFPPGGQHYLTAIPALARRRGFDVVHAHFGLTAAPALAAGGAVRGVTLHGTDMIAPRSRRITLAVLPRYDVVGVPSEVARAMLPAAEGARAELLPCGVDSAAFTPLERGEARRALGLDPHEPFALFPYDPARPVKRADLAARAAGPHRFHTLGHETRERMRLWMNAASVVLCPADWETFGIACVEALTCGTAVLARPTGVHAEALAGIPWSQCSAFDEPAWRAFVDDAVARDEQHPGGHANAARWSADAMAERLVHAWQAAAGARRQRRG